jgi:hypothetical protein
MARNPGSSFRVPHFIIAYVGKVVVSGLGGKSLSPVVDVPVWPDIYYFKPYLTASYCIGKGSDTVSGALAPAFREMSTPRLSSFLP